MKLFLFIFIFLVGGIGISQNAWTPLNDFPDETQMRTSFATNDYGYVLTRVSPNDLRLFQYDPTIDKWNQKGDFPQFFFGNYTAVVLNGEGYMLTGDDSNFTVTLWKYDETSDVWTPITNESFNDFGLFSFFGAAFANHGKIYVQTSSGGDNFRSFDPMANSWEILVDSPALGDYGTEGFSIGDRSYFIFSTEEFGDVIYRDLWEYDFTNSQWVERAPYPGFIEQGFDYPKAIFSIDDYAFVGMTYIEGNFHRYNPEDDIWEQIAPCGYFGTEATGFALNGLGYVAGGSAYDPNTGGNFPVDDVWKLDPELLSVLDENIATFQISPNPAQDLVFIHGVSTEVHYRIFNVQGTLLEKGISKNKTIYVSHLPSGMYLLSITSEEKTAVKKLLKL